MRGGTMPRVGHVIFGEDTFGRDQAKEYSRVSGIKVDPSPEIDIVVKTSSGNITKDITDLIKWYGG